MGQTNEKQYDPVNSGKITISGTGLCPIDPFASGGKCLISVDDTFLRFKTTRYKVCAPRDATFVELNEKLPEKQKITMIVGGKTRQVLNLDESIIKTCIGEEKVRVSGEAYEYWFELSEKAAVSRRRTPRALCDADRTAEKQEIGVQQKDTGDISAAETKSEKLYPVLVAEEGTENVKIPQSSHGVYIPVTSREIEDMVTCFRVISRLPTMPSNDERKHVLCDNARLLGLLTLIKHERQFYSTILNVGSMECKHSQFSNAEEYFNHVDQCIERFGNDEIDTDFLKSLVDVIDHVVELRQHAKIRWGELSPMGKHDVCVWII